MDRGRSIESDVIYLAETYTVCLATVVVLYLMCLCRNSFVVVSLNTRHTSVRVVRTVSSTRELATRVAIVAFRPVCEPACPEKVKRVCMF